MIGMGAGLGQTDESYDVYPTDSGTDSILIPTNQPQTGPQTGALITPSLPAIMGGGAGYTTTTTNSAGQTVTQAVQSCFALFGETSCVGGIGTTTLLVFGGAAALALLFAMTGKR